MSGYREMYQSLSTESLNQARLYRIQSALSERLDNASQPDLAVAMQQLRDVVEQYGMVLDVSEKNQQVAQLIFNVVSKNQVSSLSAALSDWAVSYASARQAVKQASAMFDLGAKNASGQYALFADVERPSDQFDQVVVPSIK